MDPYRFSVKAQLTSRPRVVAEVTKACRRVRPAGPPTDSEAPEPEPPFTDAIITAVSEAMNNIVLHAYDGGSDDLVEFVLEVRDGSLVVRITDAGTPANFVAPAPAPPPLAEGGMGLYLIETCVDRVEYRPGPPNVWTLEKRFPTAAPADRTRSNP